MADIRAMIVADAPSATPTKPLVRGWVWAVSFSLTALTILVWRLPDVMALTLHAPRTRAAISRIHADPAILAAVKAQNRDLASLSEQDAAARDAAWVGEKAQGGGPLIAALTGSPASQRLRETLADSHDVVRHAIVMDARGFAVAAPEAFYNWRQTPKPKFANTFPRPDAIDVGPLEWGHDNSFAACWRTTTLLDPVTRAPIGAIAVELDAARVGPFLCRATR